MTGNPKPRVSVLMAVHNGEKYLSSAIKSILDQNFKNFELIIIDDGSEDSTVGIINKFLDKRIRFYKQEKRGLAASLNQGISLAKGEYIARMDADDISLMERLEEQVNFLNENPNYAFCGTWAQLINGQGEIFGEIHFPKGDKMIRRVLMQYNPFIHPSLCLRKKALKKIGGYDESFIRAQDYDLVLRLMREYKGANLGQSLLQYRQSERSISFQNMQQSLGFALKARWKALVSGGYPLWQVAYLIKPAISYLIPPQFKIFVLNLSTRFKQDKIEARALKDKTLALFFTRGISLAAWNKVGNLDRELKPYKIMAPLFRKIDFFTYGDTTDANFLKDFQGIKVFPNKWRIPPLLYSFLIPFLYWSKLKKVDLIKTNQMDGAWTAVLAKLIFRKKLIIRCGYQLSKTAKQEQAPRWKQYLIYQLEKIAYKAADTIMVTSESDIDYINKRYKTNKRKINLVPNYIDTDLFKPLSMKKIPRSLCFVGRLTEIKNLDNLFKAITGLRVKLIIFGSGPLENGLRKYAQDNQLDVKFEGNIENERLPHELNKAEIFIMPSWREGNPKALLEAMSCGLACIGTDVEGIREIIQHKNNGYLCQNDAASIKRSILELMAKEALRRSFGENARKTILENFSLSKLLDKEIRIYQSL